MSNMEQGVAQSGLQHQLDTVQACPDLQGSFSPNVIYRILLWEHGAYRNLGEPAARDAFFANWERLAPYLIGAQMVGLENATADMPPNRLEQKYERMNDMLAKGQPRRSARLDPDELMMLRLARARLRLHDNTPLQFAPLDAYGDEQLGRSIHAADLPPEAQTYLERRKMQAAISRQREVIVIRQLYALGQQAPDVGQIYHIADIHGSLHGTIAVALRALGAKVQAIRVDQVCIDPDSYLERLLRFSAISPADAAMLAPHFERATQFGLERWAEALGAGKFGQSVPAGRMPGGYAPGVLGMLYLRGAKGALSPGLQRRWNDIVEHTPHPRDRDARSAWLDQLLTLARQASGYSPLTQ